MDPNNKILIFSAATEEPDVDEMTVEELKDYFAQLEKLLIALDQQEPEDEESEAYDDWADEHEDLEDRMDEVRELLEDRED